MIAINFASKNYRLIYQIRTGLIAGAVLLSIVMAGMLRAAYTQRADISSIEQQLKDAEAADGQVKLLLGQREQLVKDLTAMSGLMELRKLSWTRLLTSLEATVPIGVALTRVEFDPGKRLIALDGTAQSPEALRNLVVGLEKSALFKDPFLKHQSLEKGSISFNVVAVYQYKSFGVAEGSR